MSDYINDILILSTSPEEHLKILEEVLKRLQAVGLHLYLAKRSFLRPSLEYLGHRIDADGIHPMKDKVKAIQGAPLPKNLVELRSFLGLINKLLWQIPA